MRLYEVVYIFAPALDEAGIEAKLEKFHAILTAAGGSVETVDLWGARVLAYPVQGELQGHYVVVQVSAPAEALPEFERQLKLDEEVLRYLVVINQGEPTTGMSIVSERPESATRVDEDDDEDEDEVDDDDDSPPEFDGGRGGRSRHEGPMIELLNYKDVSTLSRFLTESGKILPKRTTKVTSRFQRQLGSAVKRARFLALIPYVRDHEA